MLLRDMAGIPLGSGGWVLLGERSGDEIALGFVGKLVRAVHGGRTLLTGVMRTATTDEHARRRFRRYWTFGVGSTRTCW
jgi:hypothetical protein